MSLTPALAVQLAAWLAAQPDSDSDGDAGGARNERACRTYLHWPCRDCGYTKRVTVIRFWINSYRMRVCAGSIKPSRDRILKACSCPDCHRQVMARYNPVILGP